MDTDLFGEPIKRKGPIHVKAEWAESIYKAYPRLEHKVDALKAIEKAIRRVAKEKSIEGVDAARWLWKRTAKFAASPAGQKGTFTPLPASWFNKGGYDSDEAWWYRSDDDGKPGRSAPATYGGAGAERTRTTADGRPIHHQPAEIPAPRRLSRVRKADTL